MIVTVDGPAGAGKSTVARQLAARLGFEVLDTGAMYRAITLAADRAGVSPDDKAGLTELLTIIPLQWEGERTLLNGEDVSQAIRSSSVTEKVAGYADQPVVRRFLTDQQRRVAVDRHLVSDGRDQGTIVFPDAPCKFFVTASPEVRAQRRLEEYLARGRSATFEEVLAEQARRDAQDAARAIAPLEPAADAHIIDTSALDLATVLDRLESIVRNNPEFPASLP